MPAEVTGSPTRCPLRSLALLHDARWGHWLSYPMSAEVTGSPTRCPLRSLALLPDVRWGHWLSYQMPAEVTGSPTRCPLRSLALLPDHWLTRSRSGLCIEIRRHAWKLRIVQNIFQNKTIWEYFISKNEYLVFEYFKTVMRILYKCMFLYICSFVILHF